MLHNGLNYGIHQLIKVLDSARVAGIANVIEVSEQYGWLAISTCLYILHPEFVFKYLLV